MQRILSIQMQLDSFIATLADVAEGEMRIISRKEKPVDSDIMKVILAAQGKEEPEGESSDDSGGEAEQEADLSQWLSTEIRELLDTVEGSWDSSIFTVPTPESISLHLDLPFSHPKQIERVIDLEVQDKIPFAIENFFLQPTPLTPRGEGLFDIHVTLLPQNYVDTLIKACRQAELDPPVITTLDQVSVAVFDLFPQLREENTAIIIDHDDCFYISCFLAEEVRSARYIPLPSSNGTPLTYQQKKELALRYMQRQLLSLEGRYGEEIQRVVVFSEDEGFVIQAAQILDPEVQHQQISDLHGTNDDSFFSALSLMLASTINKSKPLCNFRSRQYLFRPQIKYLTSAAKKLARPFALFMLCLTLSAGVLYGIREYRIKAFEETLQQQVAQFISGFKAEPGKEISAIQTRFGVLNAQLKEIDAALRFSPLNTFIQLARIFRDDPSIEVKTLKILGNKMIIKGSAPNYDTVDKMKRKLKRKSNGFCRPDDKTSVGVRNTVNFEFTLEQCSS